MARDSTESHNRKTFLLKRRGIRLLASHGLTEARSLRVVFSKSSPFLLANLVLIIGFTVDGATQQRKTPDKILTTAREVHDLTPGLAVDSRASLAATVTYYDPAEHNLFVQDESGGVYVGTSRPLAIAYGDQVSIKGQTTPSYRTELAVEPVIRPLGKGKVWQPVRVSYRQLASGDFDSRRVQFRGMVRAINRERHENAFIVHLDVVLPGGEVEIYEPAAAQPPAEPAHNDAKPSSLLDSEVEIVGVAGGAFDAKSELTGIIVYVQHPSDIRVLKGPAVDPAALPLTEIDNLARYRHVQDTSERVRLRGVLTYYKPGDSAVLEHDGKSIYVQTRQTEPLLIGDVVDAIGFVSDQEYAPSLWQARVISIGRKGMVAPRETTYAEAINGLQSDNLVTVTGSLVSQIHDAGLETIVIDVGGHLISGRLAGSAPLPNVRVGTRIRLTGICRIVPGGPYRAPILFHLEMRSPADLAILSLPSWFTVRHLLAVVGALLLSAGIITAWAVMLRRRVRKQTARIARSMLLANRRSALLVQINPSYSLSHVMLQICACASELLPDVACFWLTSSQGQSETVSYRSGLAASQDGTLLYERDFFGVGGALSGKLVFRGNATTLKAEVVDREEAFQMIAEVTQMAVEHCQLYEGLVHHSTHDPLTDLPNRRLCEERLQLALDQGSDGLFAVALIYMDVDRFKQVNDHLGHKAGDLYLCAISARLKERLRPGDTLARVGGDEFLAIAPHLETMEDAERLVGRFQDSFREPFLIEGQSFLGSASFGLACFPEHGNTAEDLKRCADAAMYEKKRLAAFEAEDCIVVT